MDPDLDRDNAAEMAVPAERVQPKEHPVVADVDLRERVLDVMWFRIQKTISPGQLPQRRSPSTADLQLAGGIRIDVVLNAALHGVLRLDPAELRTTWEGLAATIAHRQAIQAIRENTKGRRIDGREVSVVSIDAEDENGATLADHLLDELADPEAEATALLQARVIHRVAHEVLNQRDLDIFMRRHYMGQPLSGIASLHGLTEPGARHVYVEAAKKVLGAARRDPQF